MATPMRATDVEAGGLRIHSFPARSDLNLYSDLLSVAISKGLSLL
jgi:hypothetical protein